MLASGRPPSWSWDNCVQSYVCFSFPLCLSAPCCNSSRTCVSDLFIKCVYQSHFSVNHGSSVEYCCDGIIGSTCGLFIQCWMLHKYRRPCNLSHGTCFSICFYYLLLFFARACARISSHGGRHSRLVHMVVCRLLSQPRSLLRLGAV